MFPYEIAEYHRNSFVQVSSSSTASDFDLEVSYPDYGFAYVPCFFPDDMHKCVLHSPLLSHYA
jgi:hypothetical protein